MSYKFTINCLKFSLLGFFMLFLQMGYAQTNKKNPKEIGLTQFEGLDAAVQNNAKMLGGNAVTMLWTDTLVYKRELGEFDSKTLVPIGAASQWLTAVLVMKFVEAGKISLDDKVSQYLPIYESYGKGYITIRHCLAHFTGIQNDKGGIFGNKKFANLQEEVESFAKKEIRANAGEQFIYSHMGLSIAGRILEIVSKKKFDMLIKQQLFNPLAMRKSTFSQLDGSAISPSTGAQSTAEEYMHFLTMLLNNGKYNGQQVLTEESINELRRIETKPEQIKAQVKGMEGFNYALGSWVVEEGKDGMANVLSCTSLQGMWPMVDWCRGYALLVLVKTAQNEQRKEVFLRMKDAAEEKLPAKCR
ncbi:MAG TPA: serine hydrolase [Flavisolibacter sp.]|nr:serine hydrolase [Flavisolibacter sp.]